MRVLFVGDFRIGQSSGYAVIIRELGVRLCERGHEVTVMGIQWPRREHHLPMRIIPAEYSWIPMQMLRLHEALHFTHVILCIDIPKLIEIMAEVRSMDVRWPRICGLFPVESVPLARPWAVGLGLLDRLFVISRFGLEELEHFDLEATWLPMSANVSDREFSHDEVRQALWDKTMIGNPDLLRPEFELLLTVADNQERKDLPTIGQAVSLARQWTDRSFVWVLVTKIMTAYGWYLPDLVEQCEVADHVAVLENLTEEELSGLYDIASYLVLASQAEGACLPLFEAMAHGLTTIAPRNTAITETLEGGRGILVEPGWRVLHPWGNVHRWYTHPEALAEAIVDSEPTDPESLRDYVRRYSWDGTADILEETLQ